MRIQIAWAAAAAGVCLLLAGCGDSSNRGGGSSDSVTGGGNNQQPPVGASGPRTRYAFNNQCFALRANDNNQFVVRDGDGYTASAATADSAEPFFMKPAALGDYLLYNSQRQLLTTGMPPVTPGVTNTALDGADDGAQWTLTGVGDPTDYPDNPVFDQEPTAQFVSDYRGFFEPNLEFENFTLFAASQDNNLAVDDAGNLVLVSPGSDTPAESFSFEPIAGCEVFPEAQSNVVGQTFSGTQPNGDVLGMADVHVHISSTTFLGRAQWGSPFHRFGVTHALDDCDEYHGPAGEQDVVGAAFSGDTDGHDTTGWPTFPEWPGRDQLTHEAIYWKWLERSWQAGLRVVVNDLVDNQTLCEQQRAARMDPSIDCNPMNNAGNQAGSMYAMQDYIDAQYGGRGAGWFQIVHGPDEARQVIEDGKMAVILGIEISNLLNCQLTYNNPLRTQEPFEETGDPADMGVTYGCAMTESDPLQPNEIAFQLNRLWGLGVRQIITIHEFDNAFGGNGIFDGQILNVGNRENSGGAPDTGTPGGLFDMAPRAETPTGEFWTTYDCPVEGEDSFSGYLFGDEGGEVQNFNSPPACAFTGQGGRPGGASPCYPADVPQCNARWLTPIGLYMYRKLMEMGFIFDIDHLELEMKTQALEVAEAQDPAYPFVSTHGTFGGTSNDQAQRILRNGGLIYPSLGNGSQHISKMQELRGVYEQAMTGVPEDERPLFGFGFGTDTNGLSAQSGPRGNIEAGDEVVYPYTLFSGALFNDLDEFNAIDGVMFAQPRTADPDGNGRSWHLDMDGSAHHGMLSGMVQEMRLEGTPQNMRDLFNSAELYLRTWTRTLASRDGIAEAGGVVIPDGVLRAAPTP